MTTKTTKTIKKAAAPANAGPATTTPKSFVSNRPSAPTTDQVRLLAYQIYLRRIANNGRGDAASDWLEAERELRSTPPARSGMR